MDGPNSRLYTAEERIKELEVRVGKKLARLSHSGKDIEILKRG